MQVIYNIFGPWLLKSSYIVKRFAPFLILLVVLLASCSLTQYVNVPVNYGPKTGFRRDTTTIVVINRVNPDTLKARNKGQLGVYTSGAYSAIKTAADQLKFLPGVNTINIVDSMNFLPNPDSVKFIAKKYKATYVLVLNNYGIGIYREREFIDGQVVNYLTTKIRLRFLLYEPNGLFSKRLNGIADMPQDEQYASSFSFMYRQSLSQANMMINEGSRNAALDALKDYLPYSISNDRPLYGGQTTLDASIVQIKRGNFDAAFKLLNPLIDGTDAKLASKAAYNLAVVYEAQSDIDEALATVKISNQKYRNDYAMQLLAALMKE
jgi:tetratricopeptide (TPR) repeat protein